MDLRAMSMVGNKESGARLVPTVPSMGYGAGVPIKKRRFPFVRPPLPLLLPEETIDAKQTELVGPTNSYGISNPTVASEHPPSSNQKEPSFGVKLSENIDLNEVDRVQPDNQDSTIAVAGCKNAKEKLESLFQKSAELFDGHEVIPSSNAPCMNQKEKPREMKNIVVADRTQGKIELTLAPSGSRESPAVRGSSGHETFRFGISTDLTLALGPKIGPTFWHQGNIKELSLGLSLPGRGHCLAGEVSEGDASAPRVHVDGSMLDLNTMTDATGDSAHVFSYGTAPYGDLTLAFREDDKKDAGQNHMVEQRAVGGKTLSPYDYKESHIGRYLDLGLRPLIPYSNPSCESPSVSTICNSDDNLGAAVKLINTKVVNSPSSVKKEPADEPVDFCHTKPENRTEKCGSIDSLPSGTRLGISRSIKEETDCANRQINPVDDTPRRQEEMRDFSELPPNEGETMQVNGPLKAESCQSMLASSGVCKDQHPNENNHPLGALCHNQECDAANMASDSIVTNVAAIVLDDMVDPMPMENLPPAAKDSAMENAEDSACDGGKIQISGCEDTRSSNSNYESDGVPSALADHAEISYREDDDYEDGELREKLVFGASQVHTRADRGEHASSATMVAKCNAQLALKEDVRSQLACIEIENCVNGFSDATSADTCNIDKGESRELSNERDSSNQACPFDPGELVDGDLTKHVREEMICQSGRPSAENAVAMTLLASNERVRIGNAISIKEKGHRSRTEAPANSEVSSGKRSKRRIIDLSGLSSLSSPDKARFVSDRSLPLRTVRKRLSETALQVDKPHCRWRNKACGDDVDEFPRGRNRYSLSKNSASHFSRDRDIVSNRIARHWDVKREFIPELYNYTRERHTTRCKYATDYQNHDVASGDRLNGGKCWGRRRLNNDGPNFHRQSSTRRSPCGRGGTHVPQNISPTRYIGRAEFDVVSLFRRGLGGNDMGSMFVKCSQISCEDNPDGLARRDRKLHSFKNDRIVGQFRSNSPVRRYRSPNRASSRRRSPEGFESHLDLSQRRSPTVNQRNRMRSPDRSCFRDKTTKRQHPPDLAQNSEDVRQIPSEKDNGFLRSRFTNWSSPCRGTFRIRSYGVSTRDRPYNEYSNVHMRSGGSRDVGRDGESGERGLNRDRGPRLFLSPYSESEESGIYNKDEATLPYRLCSEDHGMHVDCGNSREKTINRSGCAQKTQKKEDLEVNYRRRRLCEEFDDQQNKRKRQPSS